MTDINERLREAAIAGAEVEIKALLREPGCNALDKDEESMTALMYASGYGHEGCVGLLIPVSEPLSQDVGGVTALMWAACLGNEKCVRLLLQVSKALDKDKKGQTASDLARGNGHESLARFIEAYVLAQGELESIGDASCPGAPGVRAARRV